MRSPLFYYKCQWFSNQPAAGVDQLKPDLVEADALAEARDHRLGLGPEGVEVTHRQRPRAGEHLEREGNVLRGLLPIGAHVHIGSQITTLEPLSKAAEAVVALAVKAASVVVVVVVVAMLAVVQVLTAVMVSSLWNGNPVQLT